MLSVSCAAMGPLPGSGSHWPAKDASVGVESTAIACGMLTPSLVDGVVQRSQEPDSDFAKSGTSFFGPPAVLFP